MRVDFYPPFLGALKFGESYLIMSGILLIATRKLPSLRTKLAVVPPIISGLSSLNTVRASVKARVNSSDEFVVYF